MAIGAFVPLAFFIFIVGSVGIRLIGLWWRTRELPELMLGAGLLVVSLSMPFSAVGRMPATAMEPVGRLCFSIAMFAVAIGISLIVFFNYWVFRRGSPWGRPLFVGLATLLFAAAAYISFANFQGETVAAIKPAMRPGTLTIMGTILVCFAWGSSEAFRYRAALRRQLALGMGDAVVANRFLLWGVASATCSLLLIVLIGCVLGGMTIVREPAPLAALAATGTIMSVTWYLTFFAPEAYQRFIRRGATAS